MLDKDLHMIKSVTKVAITLKNNSSIEYVNITDIQNQTWSFTSTSLQQPARGSRTVVYNDLLFVVGGRHFSSGSSFFDTVHIIDTITFQVTVSVLTF